ncbi:hypothetical protein DAI22_02g139700 [Oryza sativa Japonica Group]|nr:hypothetical protein DAI22_02g139700 [Oryza sativa Japonica Group]
MPCHQSAPPPVISIPTVHSLLIQWQLPPHSILSSPFFPTPSSSPPIPTPPELLRRRASTKSTSSTTSTSSAVAPPPHNLRRPAGARHRGGASLVGEPHASRLRAPGDPVPAPCAGARRRRRRCEDPLHRGQDYRPPRHHHGAPPSCRPRQHGATGSGPARRPDGRHRRRWMLLERLNRAEEEEDAMEEPEEEKLEAMPQLASGMEDLSLLLRAFIALY